MSFDLRSIFVYIFGLGLLLILCLIRAIRGPRVADRIIAVNMMGTLTIVIICVLAYLLGEDYLIDVAVIYAMLSFLAVVVLTKIYLGVYREKRRQDAGKAENSSAAQSGEKEDAPHA